MSCALQILFHGEVFYAAEATSGKRQWRPARAVLTINAILLACAPEDLASPEDERRIDLQGCHHCESLRGADAAVLAEIEDPSDLSNGAAPIQAFQLTWRNGYTEVFGCVKATQRVQWLAHIWMCLR